MSDREQLMVLNQPTLFLSLSVRLRFEMIQTLHSQQWLTRISVSTFSYLFPSHLDGNYAVTVAPIYLLVPSTSPPHVYQLRPDPLCQTNPN